jgi:hypothetical protein
LPPLYNKALVVVRSQETEVRSQNQELYRDRQDGQDNERIEE